MYVFYETLLQIIIEVLYTNSLCDEDSSIELSIGLNRFISFNVYCLMFDPKI